MATTAPDPSNQYSTYWSYVSVLADAAAKDETKLRAIQDLSEQLENITSLNQYPHLLDHAIKVFLGVLSEGEPQFLAEHTVQQIRKLILEIIHRLPANEYLKPHVRPILVQMFKLVETENEENVLVCLRIIIELHKQYRPQFCPEIQQFLQAVKKIYNDLPNNMSKIFMPRPPIVLKDISELAMSTILNDTFTQTQIQIEKKTADANQVTYNILPRATLSLKVLAELPIIVVLMYQLYKNNVHQEVAEFIPLIMNTITLQPSPENRSNSAFNREVFVDFMAAQIKTLSFLAYIIRLYQDQVTAHHQQLTSGMLSLLKYCPNEVAHLRKELLIAARHILATELRNKFVGCINELFDESVLIGSGWTAHESLRPLAYSTVADLVHHVRNQLSTEEISAAVKVFSRNVHDESLPTSIQTMSCKLLLNLVESLKDKCVTEPNANARELLIRMLEVFVLKFKSVAELQLPAIQSKPNLSTQSNSPSANVQGTPVDHKQTDEAKAQVAFPTTSIGDSREEKQRFGFPPSPATGYTVADCKSLVKTLVCGVKTITWGIPSYKMPTLPDASTLNPNAKHFHPKETIIFIRLVKYAMQALDIYCLNNSGQPINPMGPSRQPSTQNVRSKEEKEVLEHFAGVFQSLSPQTFREVFSTMIDYVVERIHANYALQIVANHFLANPSTSPIFATILVEYLLERMEEMGTNQEKSALYLKLFKLVFGSVSLFAAENEQMLKPHLHSIVNRSMELALSAKEPYNYFLLLRALFRSIGGGSHDLLYQEFLPLLPSLLQGLNSLQSGLHKQHMKDLFVELCLTVPVRLSSLLPYLPMLMDPLVSALNGSQNLVSQGLRTLELCVDNLQPDFLYDHIQPVRAELMQALWRTLRNPNDNVAQVSFRVLGKFGGGNRKMLMTEPQRIEYRESREAILNGTPSGSTITIFFPDHKQNVLLPVDRCIEVAFKSLKSSSTDPFYRRQCWEVIRGYLVAHIQNPDEEDKFKLKRFFNHSSFTQGDIPAIHGQFYRHPDQELRKVHEMALTGMFVAAAIKELRTNVLPFMVQLVRHYTLVAISQQCGPINLSGKQGKLHSMDALVLVDAVAAVMGHEEKELCKPGHLALIIILDTASTVLGTKERACQLPLTEYLVERMCALCYERAWYAKLGGCIAIKFLFERMTLQWVFAHQYMFLKALLFVMMDLTGEVSSGAVDMAKTNLEKMLTLCATPIAVQADGANLALIEAQRKSLNEVTQELVRQVTSPNNCVRQQAINSLQILAKTQNKSVTDIMEPHKDILVDMIPPKKHQLRHQPVNTQIGIMDGNTFCVGLGLFTIDITIPEHETFFEEIFKLCDTDDAQLLKLPCFKNQTNLVPLRKSALRALAACHYIHERKDKIFSVLYKALNSSNSEIQDTGFDCMKQFIANVTIEAETLNAAVRPFFTCIMQDFRSLTSVVVQRLIYLSQLFPSTFVEQLCEKMLQHLKKWLEHIILATRQNRKCTEEMKLCASIITFFTHVPTVNQKFAEILLGLVFKAEKAIMIEPGSLLRKPLRKFLQRYPEHTLDLLLTERNINEDQIYRFVKFLLKGDEGAIFRSLLQTNPSRIVKFASGQIQIQEKISMQNQPQPPAQDPAGNPVPPKPQTQTINVTYDLQFQAILITSVLIKHNDDWFSTQQPLIDAFKRIWTSDAFHHRHVHGDVDYVHWKEPKLLAKCLLNYFRHNRDDIELLFQLLRAFTGRYICDFDFLREFLEECVLNYSIPWKRSAFFKFVEIFHATDGRYSQDLKAKILQYIIIPSFSDAFEKKDGESLIGGPPAPDSDSPDNLISVFINKIIDPEANSTTISDAVRILLLQFSCLIVEQASSHIHDAANKRQGNKLRRLMTFAWPCLLVKNCVDPATKYHGHLLLAYIISKFAIHKRIVLQVFHSLLKAYAVEARTVVRQALEILTPAMPQRMEDGNSMLTHWTKKIIIEEGHTLAQLVHMLQLLVRHFKVYFPVRHHLIQHMVSSVQRLGFTPNASIDHKKIAVDLAEVIIRWELMTRAKDEPDSEKDKEAKKTSSAPATPQPQPGPSTPAATAATPASSKATVEINKPVEKHHADSIVNFLLRLACHVNESSSGGAGSATTGEMLSRRCVQLLKVALKTDVWPNAELRLMWFDKLLCSVELQNANYGNICTALELLVFLLSILRKEVILSSFKPLQKGIAACLTCTNTKVIRGVHLLLCRLMAISPIEANALPVASKHDELELLYSSINKIIGEGLSNYEKIAQPSPQSLFSILMILKAACSSSPAYIDRHLQVFMRILQKMARDHLSPPTQSDATQPMSNDLLILSLDLVKNRMSAMSPDMRKMFLTNILIALIEKSNDVKVLKAITKMVEDWVKHKPTVIPGQPTGIQAPTLREKAILLMRMMSFIEKRFPDDADLNGSFLELVNYVYCDDQLKNTELTVKLEQAFMAGLRCTQPSIRTKFFSVFDASVKRKLFDRLMYIAVSQNWENIGNHFWIKQCIEFLIITSHTGLSVQSGNLSAILPSPTSVINLGDQNEKAAFANISDLFADFGDPPSIGGNDSMREADDDMDIEISSTEEGQSTGRGSGGLGIDANAILLGGPSARRPSTPSDPKQALQFLITKQAKFLETMKEVRTIQFLTAIAQLCHMETQLAQHIWIQLLPRLWRILNEKQQQQLSAELIPFVCSGSHVLQKDNHPSAIGTFVEAMSICDPPIPIRPQILKYLGKSHNLWHRAALMLENVAFDTRPQLPAPSQAKTRATSQQATTSAAGQMEPDINEPVIIPQQPLALEAVDSLAEIYELLKEEDLVAGLWQKRAKYPETMTALAYEQQGFFEQAQGAFELAMTKARQEYNTSAAPPPLHGEYRLWEKHWIRCAKELNQWDLLLEYGHTKEVQNAFLVLESSWRVPNWALMKESLFQVEHNCPKEYTWKIALYKGYNSICNDQEHNLGLVDRMVDLASNFCIKEWRRLPHVVSHIHIGYLQAAQQIMELSEAGQIHQGFLPNNMNRNQSLHDMRAIVKTWRNRLPVLADDLSHWSDIFTWRQHHYQAIIQHYEAQSAALPAGLGNVVSSQGSPGAAAVGTPTTPGGGPLLSQAGSAEQNSTQAMLGVHASAQSIIHFGKIARKHGQVGVCLDWLSRIHTIPSVPIIDCFQKIKQQVKCYLQLSNAMGKNELQEGLELIDSTNLKYFSKEMTAEFYALKGMFLSQIGRGEEANKAFSAAAQLHDALGKAWALWGDYLESVFTRERFDQRNMQLGASAMICYMHACRQNQNETKSRKYLAKVLWLLTYDDKDNALEKAVKQHNAGVPPVSWLPWIPQLLTWLVRSEGKLVLEILSGVGRLYPQAVYFPLRTLYLTLKIEQREKQQLQPPAAAAAAAQTTAAATTTTNTSTVAPAAPNKQPILPPPASPSTAAAAATSTTAASTTGAPSPTQPTTTTASATTAASIPPGSQNKPEPSAGGGGGVGNQVPVDISMWRVSKIMHTQRDLHPTVLSSLEGIVDQITGWFRENWYEDVLHRLKQALGKCYTVAFENRTNIAEATVTPHTLNFVKKLVSTFGIGLEHVSSGQTSFATAASESIARRAQATAQDPVFQKMKVQFTADFDFSSPGSMKLLSLINKLKKWIKILESKTRLLPRSLLIEEKCRFLSTFSQQTAEVELPGEFLVPKHNHYYVRIARFLPRVEIVNKHNTAARRLYIRGHNGKVYPYLVVNDGGFTDARREERILQLLRFLNLYLGKQKETAKRFLSFTVPRVVAISPQTRLVEDNPASISLLDIYKEHCIKKSIEPDAPIARYYERLSTVQSSGRAATSHQVLRDVLKDIQKDMVSVTVLRDWAQQAFPSATDLWTFRKQFTLQLALASLAEYMLHLTRLNPDMIYIHQDSGLMNVAYFKFDVDDLNGELESNRPVPFRLTHNISEFITAMGVSGPFTAAIIAAARCFVQPNFKVQAILRTILRDEMMAWYKKTKEDEDPNETATMTGDKIVQWTNKALTSIMQRLQSLATFEGSDSKVNQLVAAANSHDNLCRMDPAWHPWL